MSKKKAIKTKAASVPSVAVPQVKPPQPKTLEEMKPEELHGKVLQLDVQAVPIENIIRQGIPAHLMAHLDLRLTHIEASHTMGAPHIMAWVAFSPRAQAVNPAPAAAPAASVPPPRG